MTMGRCEICGQVNGHAEGCPNSGKENRNHGGEIRCSFCGTINPVGQKKCCSCNASLEGSLVRERINSLPPEPNGHRFNSSEMRQPTVGEDSDEGNSRWPVCGYVLRPGVKKCPSCQNNLEQNGKVDNGREQSDRISRNQSEPVWNIANTEFKIGLCDKNGNLGESKTYTEDDVVLGREELAPNDIHISRKHIHVTNEGGQWYIEDISSTHQTYLVVKGKTPIDNGDIIVLGNKFFRFVTE